MTVFPIISATHWDCPELLPTSRFIRVRVRTSHSRSADHASVSIVQTQGQAYLTPPEILRRSATGDINYDRWSSQDRYKWIEYHKWTFKGSLYTKLVGDLVLMTRAQFGYLGYYNRKWGYSPFEGFLVGGDGMSGYNSYGSEVIAPPWL